jgi:hypothetical protein
MQQISQRQHGLTTSLDQQRETLDGLLTRLTEAQQETAAVAERSAARISEGTAEITRRMGAAETQAHDAISGIRAAASGFVDEAGALSRQAQQAEQQTISLFDNAAALQDKARQLRESLQSESDRATGALDALLGKIGSGSGELRDISAATENKLVSLQGAINEKASSLDENMQRINERQRDLAGSVDQQRETLNALLNRLAMAQDETSALAERHAARLADSAQNITKQITVIDATAQNALASVKAVSAGFTNEAGTLGMQAQQTEQQIRGMLSVTAAMQDQARQLRESIQGESSRVIEQLGHVVARIDATGEQFRQQSNSAVNVMDQSVLQFTSLASTTGDSLQKQAETLGAVAEQAETRVASAGDRIRSHFRILTDAAELTEQQARQMADTAEYATSRLVTLRGTMADSDRDGRDILAQAGARIAEVKATLQRELEHVAEISNLAVQQGCPPYRSPRFPGRATGGGGGTQPCDPERCAARQPVQFRIRADAGGHPRPRRNRAIARCS